MAAGSFACRAHGSAHPAGAADRIWVGGAAVTGDWFDAANWDGGATVPADGDAVAVTNGKILLTNATAALASFSISNATLIFSNWDTALSAASVTVCSSGTLTHVTNSAAATNVSGQWAPDARVRVVCSNFTLAIGGRVDVKYCGYRAATNGSMKGCGPGGGGAAGYYGGAGGHGSRGASGSQGAGGISYGLTNAPVDPGSGGGGNVPGGGGGAVRIDAAGAVTLNGLIDASGRQATTHGGPGSGGSIYISCRTFAGTADGLLR